MAKTKQKAGRPGLPPEEKKARADRLRALRDHLKKAQAPGGPWAQDDVAERARVERTNYNSMERGVSAFGGDSMRRVARAYDLEADDLALYLRGRITLDQVLERRVPSASVLVSKLEACPRLKVALKRHPGRWPLGTLIRALGAVREGAREPDWDWADRLDRVAADRKAEIEAEDEDPDPAPPASAKTPRRAPAWAALPSRGRA